MRLGELLTRPELRLSVLTGAEQLDREVASVLTTDLLDPRRYVQPAALVLSGLMWRRTPADSDQFVAGLVSAGVVALAAGEAAFDGVPEDLVDACNQYGMPLLAVPVDVSFADISAYVLTRLGPSQDQALVDQLSRHRRLVSMVAQGAGMDELIRVVGKDIGVDCVVLTTTGRRVAGVAAALVPADLDLFTRAYLTAHRLPAVATAVDDQAYSLFAVDSPTGQRLTGWFIAGQGDHRSWDDATTATLRELGSAVSLERARLDEGLRFQRRISDEIVGLVAAGQARRADVAVRLRDLGIDPDARFALAVASSPGRPDFTETARLLLDDAGQSVAERGGHRASRRARDRAAGLVAVGTRARHLAGRAPPARTGARPQPARRGHLVGSRPRRTVRCARRGPPCASGS